MASSTSSDIDLKIYDNYGNDIPIPPLKKETSETDLYLNMLANPSKAKLDTEKSTSSLRFDDKKNSDTSSVRNSYKGMKESSKNNAYSAGSDHMSDHRSDHKSDHRSDHKLDHRDSYRNRDSHVSRSSRSSDSSRARYEDVRLSEKTDIEEKKPVLTGQQLRMKKIELLRKLCDLKTKGYKLSKEYDFNSSIEEMEYEFDLLKSFADRRNGIKLYKSTIINVTNLVEFFNDKYDPFGAQLNGWSEHMSVEVDSYDDVLEELYEKYKGAGKSLPPEIKLLILIGFSASAFHFSKKHMSNMPMGTAGVSAPGGNPLGGLQSGIAQKIASMGKPPESKFMSEQELNIKRQRDEMREQDRLMKEQMRQNATQMPLRQQSQQPPQMKSFVPSSMQPSSVQVPPSLPKVEQPNFANAKAPVNFSKSFDTTDFTPGGPPNLLMPNKDPRPVISQNQTVKDVLNRLHNRAADTQDTQDETTTNNDRLLSDTTASEGKKKGRKKKPLMQI
jgi:hypothetical protein